MEVVAYHGNVKLYVVPVSQGVTVSTVPESMDISYAEDGAPTNRGKWNPEQNNQQHPLPTRLRQNIQHPLRFGEYVIH